MRTRCRPLRAGVQYDSFRRELFNSYDSATRVWLGLETKIRKNISASARIENTHSQQFSQDTRGRLALNVDF